MKEALLSPPSPQGTKCAAAHTLPYSLGTRLRPLLLPLILSSVLAALVLLQALSFFFLYDRLETVRIRLDREATATEKREAFIIQEVELLKGQMLILAEDHSHQGQHYLRAPPPYPPPPPPPLRPLTPFTRAASLTPQPKDKDHGNRRRSHKRGKRRASDTSYGVRGGGLDLREGELSVQLQGENTENRSEANESLLELTSYARIPDKPIDISMYNAIQEFCRETRTKCPPGPPGPVGPEGPPGRPGDEGERGETGIQGEPGSRGQGGMTGMPGSPGPQGPNGVKGEIGLPGRPGLDGRDGLPGEPGLDGIPGRNGLDGIPGIDGIPGLDGQRGRDGVNGTDGSPGHKGERGLRGPQGTRGIAGPRGRKGKDGKAGRDGEPGISALKVNGSEVNKLLIPPSIPGRDKRKPIVVREGDNLRLRCKAAGEPRPEIEWSKEGGGVIPTGKWKDGSLNSHILNLTHIHREHTGTYQCEAYNGIPPNAVKRFNVEVHFDPYIRVNQWKVGTFNGSTARLECQVQAFPIPITYWEDQIGRILDNSTKYKLSYLTDPNYIWKSMMVLEIFDIEGIDFGDYHCLARNELAVTSGLVKVHEIDPTLHIPSTGTVDGLSFGPDPPVFVDLFDDLCPPPPDCPDCPKTPKCAEGRGTLYGVRADQFGNDTYPGFKNRTFDCLLSAVGKPVYHRHTDSDYGAWMRDPSPRDPQQEAKFWTTNPSDPNHLYEFADKNRYRKNLPSKNYTLPRPFTGNSHVIYNGSFYYHQRGHQSIITYDLNSGHYKSVPVPQVATDSGNYLYSETRDYIDFSTDENGLWAIYGLPSNNNTVVMKIEPRTLKVEYSWNISLSHHRFGELFITCGVLYAIDSTTERDTKIRFALDLYRKEIHDVDLPFNNPFRKTTMLGYNPNTREIYSWDSGNQLTYPIKYNAIGDNSAHEERGGPEASAHQMDFEKDYEVHPLTGS